MEPLKQDEPPKHPAAHRLDAVAAGDSDAGVTAHLAACEACAAYVSRLQAGAAQFRSGQDARAFVARVRARGASAQRARRWSRVAWIATPVLAAAAAVGLYVRTAAHDPAPPSATRPVPTVTETPRPTGPQPERRFKGGLVVAVVRERGGRQERLTGPLTVADGDRIRVEVSTDHDGPLSAGLLSDDGQWVPLLSPAALEAGTHYSELAARFDDTPTNATLLAGEPEAVDRARRTGDFAGVVAWRVTSGPP